MNRLQAKLEKIGSDPKLTAKAVGLRYAANSVGGYSRKASGKNFKYFDADGELVTDKELLERFRTLVLPPAWQDVWISKYENSHLQATGIDSKGRKQYRYHPHWNKMRNQSKFYRLRSFALALPKIREQVDKDLSRKDLCYEKVIALVIRLMEDTNIRIGNDAYKRLYGSFGLTTLRDKHVQIENNTVTFEFIGKKGVKHQIDLKSRKLANLVKKCKEIPGYDLFQYYDKDGSHHTISSTDVNNYLKQITEQDFTAKDFRAWSGTKHALSLFRNIGEFETKTDFNRKVIEVIDSVSSKLGNTRSVCKKYYVHPSVIASYESGSIAKYTEECIEKSNGLEMDEELLLHLLENEKIAEALV